MQPSYNIKKITTVLALISIFFIIVGCDTLKYKRADVKDNPVNVKERARKNVAEGKGFSLGNIGNSGNGNFDFASSNPLWRASLEILDFTPLSNVDYSGGIIITDWFDNENDKNSNLKISIKFLSNEIRADGLNVQIYEKICKNNNCTTRKLENNVSNEIKATILKKASLIVKKQKGKRAKDYFKKNPIDPADAMKD
jgi:hypothetical protein